MAFSRRFWTATFTMLAPASAVAGCVSAREPGTSSPAALPADAMAEPMVRDASSARHEHGAGDLAPHRASELFQIELDGFSPALGFVPQGAGPFPVWIVAHGAGGRAQEWLRYWVELTEHRAIVLSLAGTPLSSAHPEGGHFFVDHLHLGREVNQLLARFSDSDENSAEYAARAAPLPWGYAGYSQGATMGAWYLLDKGETFDRAVLIEGGLEGWTLSRAESFGEAGYKKVLFVCGTSSCNVSARGVVSVAKRAGLDTRYIWVEGAGHIYWGEVASAIEPQLAWLSDGGVEPKAPVQ